jgi:hypothetical protein
MFLEAPGTADRPVAVLPRGEDKPNLSKIKNREDAVPVDVRLKKFRLCCCITSIPTGRRLKRRKSSAFPRTLVTPSLKSDSHRYVLWPTMTSPAISIRSIPREYIVLNSGGNACRA